MPAPPTAEDLRLADARERGVSWRRWGPYLSDRQWGTVREDYSAGGEAWSDLDHDQARARAYRWGEDGIAGISDDRQHLCFALALWNGADPFLKERYFGLTGPQGNHGEDAKEYWFHLDNLPSHAYMRMLYKYPQRAFPYQRLLDENRRRTRADPEFELLDTGIFDDDRYFDVFVEYAKAAPEDLLIRITACNRGPEASVLHLLPTLWFRNDWSWQPGRPRPRIAADGPGVLKTSHRTLEPYWLYFDPRACDDLLFTENESNAPRLWGSGGSGWFKDAFHDRVVHGRAQAVNPGGFGSKASPSLQRTIGAGQSVELRLRLANAAGLADPLGPAFDALFAQRRAEADAFYRRVTPFDMPEDLRRVQRQAFAGLLWSKQWYHFAVQRWLDGDPAQPPPPAERLQGRNHGWRHLDAADVISMPDKWEYPWFAAWDLAFHCEAYALIDADFAKQQLLLLTREWYMHPNGQIPAYEWNFGDVNPPVHAWALALVSGLEREMAGAGGQAGETAADADDLAFLQETFSKLLVNFTWWVNRKDPSGKNLFQGGFLGLDNVGVFDRSAGVPGGGSLEQSDGTAWMAFYSQNMLELALALSEHDPAYEGFITKFVHHWFQIAAAMDPLGEHPDEMWDEEDGFFYDVLRLPDGSGQRLKVRSLVGLLPLCATAVVPQSTLERFPHVAAELRDYLDRNGDLLGSISDPRVPGVDGRRLLALVDERKLRRLLARMLDEDRFLGPHGIRSVSKWHEEHPYSVNVAGQDYTVGYEPAESRSGMFGGNSNWRGPVWLPINALLVRALLQFYLYYGDDFTVECPTGSGREMTLYQVAEELSRRLVSTFTRDEQGRRPVYGGSEPFQDDPTWGDNILFFEYFHGDNGAGIGASHQTGWTGVVARLAQMFASTDAQTLLHGPSRPFSVPYRRLLDQPLASADTARLAR